MAKPFEPRLEQILAFCAADPIERVFLEDVARRDLGRFCAFSGGDGLDALCHVGANVVPSGRDCRRFAEVAARSRARMIIGDERAVAELWSAARRRMPTPREDRPAQPVYVIDEPPEPGVTGLRPATADDYELLVPAWGGAPAGEKGVETHPPAAGGVRWSSRLQIDEGRSWIWREGDTILFKAEASAWTPSAVQLQQVWVDPDVRNHKNAQRGMRDLIRLLLTAVPSVCLFVRPENAPAIRVYEAVGMRRHGSYRSLVF